MSSAVRSSPAFLSTLRMPRMGDGALSNFFKRSCGWPGSRANFILKCTRAFSAGALALSSRRGRASRAPLPPLRGAGRAGFVSRARRGVNTQVLADQVFMEGEAFFFQALFDFGQDDPPGKVLEVGRAVDGGNAAARHAGVI